MGVGWVGVGTCMYVLWGYDGIIYHPTVFLIVNVIRIIYAYVHTYYLNIESSDNNKKSNKQKRLLGLDFVGHTRFFDACKTEVTPLASVC